MTRYRIGASYLIAALMIVALSSRLYLSHGSDYYESLHNTEQCAADNGEWVDCNCPVCHEENFLATEAKLIEYNPIISILLCEYGVEPTALANNIVVATSLRGPPALS